jgi:hypothetical protein
VTLETLVAATRRAVADQVGVAADTPSDQINATLGQRAPAAAAELARAERELASPAMTDAQVLELTRRLHQLAYPLSNDRRMKETA